MAAGETETSTFVQSRVLMDMYGSEESFNALAAEEAKALTSPEGIENFLKAKLEELARSAGGSALRWISAELLKALGLGGGPSELEQIKAMLDKVLQQQALILAKLDDLLAEVKFQHLITRGYPSVQQISNLHDQLRRLSNVLGQPEREREAARLKAAILDVNGGTMASLKVISDVLLGKDPMAPTDPLIRLFSSRWLPLFLDRQLAVDVPLSTYWRRLDEWLHGLFMVQYMGLAQLANARIANRDFEILEQEIADTVRNMTAQRLMLEEVVPKWTRTLPGSMLDGRWYVLRGPRNGGMDTSHVLYGSPATGYRPLDYTVQFRRRNDRNGDEEWLFEKVGANDAFILRQRSRPCFVTSQGGGVRVEPTGMPLRLVMAPTPGGGGWGREAYVPAIGFVGSNAYICWMRPGAGGVVRLGPRNEAAHIDIVPAGH